jgi:predicted Zn-dependent protease
MHPPNATPITPGARAAGLCMAFSLALSATPLGRAQSTLPQLGDGQAMSVAAERQLGQRIAREIYRDPDYLDDPVLADYLQRIWQPLLQAARARGDITPELHERFAWQVMLARDRSVNAFALPGAYLGVHLGLIAIVGNRDELASVLAHELSHVTQRHIARMTAQQSQQTPWVLGAMILGALAARKNTEAANAVIAGSQAASAQSQLNFSRDMEREADRVGYQVLQDAQFNVQGFVGMFDKLALANRINDNGSFPYLRSHPLTSERIGDMQARVQQSAPLATPRAEQGSAVRPLAAADDAAIEHAIMAARARLLADPAVDPLRSELAQARSVAASRARDPAAPSAKAMGQLYGGALAALKLRELASASGLAALALGALDLASNKSATHTYQSQAAIIMLASEIAIAQDRAAQAHSLLQAYVPLKPSSGIATTPFARSALLLWAQASAAPGAPPDMLPQAVEQLQTWVALQPQDALAWDALAGAYTAQNQSLRAIRAQAEARVALLDYSAALDRLKAGQALALQAGHTAHIERSIIDARTRTVQGQVRELHADKPSP